MLYCSYAVPTLFSPSLSGTVPSQLFSGSFPTPTSPSKIHDLFFLKYYCLIYMCGGGWVGGYVWSINTTCWVHRMWFKYVFGDCVTYQALVPREERWSSFLQPRIACSSRLGVALVRFPPSLPLFKSGPWALGSGLYYKCHNGHGWLVRSWTR